MYWGSSASVGGEPSAYFWGITKNIGPVKSSFALFLETDGGIDGGNGGRVGQRVSGNGHPVIGEGDGVSPAAIVIDPVGPCRRGGGGESETGNGEKNIARKSARRRTHLVSQRNCLDPRMDYGAS